MATLDKIKKIIIKIVNKTANDDDFEFLSQVCEEILQLLDENEKKIVIQYAKQVNNIGKAENSKFGDRTDSSDSYNRVQRPRAEKLLLDEVKKDIKGRLSLRLFIKDTKPINLNKELQQELVNCPWTQDLKTRPNFKGLTSEASDILEIFDHDEIAGKLLIVGQPGAGKTTTLLELTQKLILRAEKDCDAAIPVLLNLASWRDKQSIDEWIIEALKRKAETIHDFLQEQKILPILDGLDELEVSDQELCIRAINIFLTQENRPSSLVVCGRREEYINCKTRLDLNGAVCLLPLSDEQIEAYLKQIENTPGWHLFYLKQAKNTPSWNWFYQDSILLELVRVPLFLNIALVACQDKSPTEWENIKSSEERLEYLWNGFISEKLKLSDNRAKNQQKLRWLIWIAQQLTQKSHDQESSKVSFVISQLQPNQTLEGKLHKIYAVTLFIIFILIIELAIYLQNDLVIESYQSIIPQTIILLFLIVFVVKFTKYINPVEKIISLLQFSKLSVAITLFTGLISGLYYKLNFIFFEPNFLLFFSVELNVAILLYILIINFILIVFFTVSSTILQINNDKKSILAIVKSSFITALGLINSLMTTFKYFLFQAYITIIIFIYFIFSIFIFVIFLCLNFDVYSHSILDIFLKSILIIPFILFLYIGAFMGKLNWGVIYTVILLPSLPLLTASLFISTINYFFGSTENIWYISIINGLTFGQITQTILKTKADDASAIESAEKATHSNQAIRKSLINATIIGFTTTIIIALVKDFSQGIGIGFIFWLLSGGIACIQHFTLRLILYYNGNIPWNYNKFLKNATKQLLLQEIGGSYKFIHRLLQEHLVNMSFEGEKDQ